MNKSSPLLSLSPNAKGRLEIIWLLTLLCAVIGFSSAKPPSAWWLSLLGLSGLAIAVLTDRITLIFLWRSQKLLWTAWALVGVGAAAAEWWASAGNYNHFFRTLSPQAGLVWCLPALSVFMAHAKIRAWTVIALATLCAWHAVTIPLEAVTGIRIGWLTYEVVVRQFGWLTYQPAGLSSHPYLFAGFYLPIFYLAWGSFLSNVRTYCDRTQSPWVWRCYLILPWFWLAIAACLQSRSSFVGTLAATCLCTFFSGPVSQTPDQSGATAQGSSFGHDLKKRWRWFGMALAIVGAATIAYWLLTLSNKTGLGLRAAYWQVYLDAAIKWPAVIAGHGFLSDRSNLAIPGLPYIWHSHNDLLEILYSWGSITLLPYLVFMATLTCLLFRRWREGQTWLLSAAVCVFPSMVTDLGLHHYEKANLMMLLAAFASTAFVPLINHNSRPVVWRDGSALS